MLIDYFCLNGFNVSSRVVIYQWEVLLFCLSSFSGCTALLVGSTLHHEVFVVWCNCGVTAQMALCPYFKHSLCKEESLICSLRCPVNSLHSFIKVTHRGNAFWASGANWQRIWLLHTASALLIHLWWRCNNSNISLCWSRFAFWSVINCVWTCWPPSVCFPSLITQKWFTTCLSPLCSPLFLPPPDGVSGLHPCSSSSPPPRPCRQQRHFVSLWADHGSHTLSSGEHGGCRAGNRAGVPGTLWARHQRQPGGHRVAGDWGRWD